MIILFIIMLKQIIVNIKLMIINESRRFTVFDDNVLNLDIIYNKLYPVWFNPDTLINTNRALWTNARIFRGLELWRHPREGLFSSSA